MSVGVFVECYILAAAPRERRWHWLLLAIFVALVLLSRDATAFICSLLYMGGTYIYSVFGRSLPVGMLALSAVSLLGLALFVSLLAGSSPNVSLLNRDMTLTGRTNLWPMVLEQIRHRPILGWGYAATWQESDSGPLMIARVLNWVPGHAHNEWLEITLQLGLAGATLVLTVIGVTFMRGLRCADANRTMLGFFVLLFVLGTSIHGVTEVVLVQSQSIAWVVFSVLGFKAGQEVLHLKARRRSSQQHVGQPA
jgi:O-antigen ligase